MIDTGDPDNIHQVDKKEAGERLALCALGEYYGCKIPHSGPTLASVERLPGTLKLQFDHTDGGLVVKGERLGEFSLAGLEELCLAGSMLRKLPLQCSMLMM